MKLSRKEVRNITGFTFTKVGSNANNWLSSAIEFNKAAMHLAASDDENFTRPFCLNAALSLELILKAIIKTRGSKPAISHNLNELCKSANLNLSSDRQATLELLSTMLVWSGRYPVPNKETDWDKYLDTILERHIIREQEGNIYRVLKNPRTFPNPLNYNEIWSVLVQAYEAQNPSGA
jgi:HEPN domain-containing protein